MFIEKLKAYKKGKKQFLFSSLPTKRPKKTWKYQINQVSVLNLILKLNKHDLNLVKESNIKELPGEREDIHVFGYKKIYKKLKKVIKSFINITKFPALGLS